MCALVHALCFANLQGNNNLILEANVGVSFIFNLIFFPFRHQPLPCKGVERKNAFVTFHSVTNIEIIALPLVIPHGGRDTHALNTLPASAAAKGNNRDINLTCINHIWHYYGYGLWVMRL